MIDLTKEHFDTLIPISPLSEVWEYKCKLCGIRHFGAKDGWNTEIQLGKTKAHDIFKPNWAKTHNIILKRFSYKGYDNLILNNMLGGEYN